MVHNDIGHLLDKGHSFDDVKENVEESNKANRKFDYLFTLPLILILTITGYSGWMYGEKIVERSRNPNIIYERKIEGDSRNFLVTESHSGYKIPFVETSQGVYKRLENIQESESERLQKDLTSKLTSEK